MPTLVTEPWSKPTASPHPKPGPNPHPNQAGAKAEGGKPLTDEKGAPVAALRALAAWGPERKREAEAICRLLPIGFPYQYPNLPLTAQKVRLLADWSRVGLRLRLIGLGS